MIRRHRFFVAILLIVAAARFAILFLSQTHVHSDEAIIGLMGKHILEGRYFPLYMYGQPYNAAAAWEAYLAVVPFAIFGVGVLPLKAGIVLLSLACLVLFYRMTDLLFGRRPALLATIVFALMPSLLKWHFQVRGYSWYFLSIPILTILFFSIWSSPGPKTTRAFFFGLVSGLTLWGLELSVTLILALCVLLLLRRNFSWKGFSVVIAGFLVGYAPAIIFNLTHHFSNWQSAFAEKIGGNGLFPLFNFSTFKEISIHEMPRFFGPDTILWYYPERPISGFIFYGIALLAFAVALWPFIKAPSKIIRSLRGDPSESPEERDLLMLILTAACFVPYVTAPLRVPGYFLGGCFFLAPLIGRMLDRFLGSPTPSLRAGGIAILATILITGSAVMIDVARHNQIETLTPCPNGNTFCLTRIPARDIEGVEEYLRKHQITSVWTTFSFVYPLLFESGEKLAVSDAIFGDEVRAYPPTVPWHMPANDLKTAFAIEANSPFRSQVEARCAAAPNGSPLMAEYGALIVLAIRPPP